MRKQLNEAGSPVSVDSLNTNDFVIKLANVNGTGSASANGLLRKSIFRMGIPVNAKNYFPSNIQGLPTWFEIRVNSKGYQARSGKVDISVAMNAQTYLQDVTEISPGGMLIYDSSWPLKEEFLRDDINNIGIPLASLCAQHFSGSRIRILMKNVVYVGAIAYLIGIETPIIQALLKEQFSRKPKLIQSNLDAIMLGYNYAKKHYPERSRFRLESLGATKDKIIIDGNTAIGLACVYAGATVGAWYPITPSTSVMDAFERFCRRFRVDEDAKKNYCIIQAEDELAAIGMVIGANWCGARAFTPTSGPGISLMSEFIGYAYFAEIPAVIIDIQRVGPSTGMPTRTQQSDLSLCAYASHGDTKHIVLMPCDPAECFSMTLEAFDLAEGFQTPVFLLSDLDIGMNDWVCDRFIWDDQHPVDRGKVLDSQALESIDQFHRYLDEDGDGICPRTLPGSHPNGAFFTRGSGHNKQANYTESPTEYQEVVDRLLTKTNTAKTRVPCPILEISNGNKEGIIAFGSSHCAVEEALVSLQNIDIQLDYMRIRAFPFHPDIEQYINSHEKIYIVEQNRDAQLKMLLVNETNILKANLVSILHYAGQPICSEFIVNAITQFIHGNKANELY